MKGKWTQAVGISIFLLAILPGCRRSQKSPSNGHGASRAPAKAQPQPGRADPYRMDFRIAPGRPNSDARYTIDNDKIDTYQSRLASQGPLPGHQRGDDFLWFPLRGTRIPQAAIVGRRGGKDYILLCAQPHRVMLHERQADGSLAWRIVRAEPTMQDSGNVGVRYTFDEPGARRFSRLLNDHDGGYFCPLMNDIAYGVVYISPGHSGLWRSGTIRNVGTREEAIQLAAAINRVR